MLIEYWRPKGMWMCYCIVLCCDIDWYDWYISHVVLNSQTWMSDPGGFEARSSTMATEWTRTDRIRSSGDEFCGRCWCCPFDSAPGWNKWFGWLCMCGGWWCDWAIDWSSYIEDHHIHISDHYNRWVCFEWPYGLLLVFVWILWASLTILVGLLRSFCWICSHLFW